MISVGVGISKKFNSYVLNINQSSYRQIFKATSLFGGVQVFNILLSIIRSKIIAVLLGPVGMGVAGLLTSTTALVGGITNFGLGTSAVRDVAAANESGHSNRISKVVTVFRRLVWITGNTWACINFNSVALAQPSDFQKQRLYSGFYVAVGYASFCTAYKWSECIVTGYAQT